ncbi:hypothetical protein EYF80_028769 [Liparis tanakae]|uniref:Transmembrane protein n=1 Tax=Liparis tanakae TaxID=230148 RepID=A0A4Z2H5R8_9TELE|nr:hypothetical protein EYF80_028769 [Liparis tanakae]
MKRTDDEELVVHLGPSAAGFWFFYCFVVLWFCGSALGLLLSTVYLHSSKACSKPQPQNHPVTARKRRDTRHELHASTLQFVKSYLDDLSAQVRGGESERRAAARGSEGGGKTDAQPSDQTGAREDRKEKEDGARRRGGRMERGEETYGRTQSSRRRAMGTFGGRPRNEKQGHMGRDSEHNRPPDVPAEAVRRLSPEPRPLLPLPGTQGQLARAAPPPDNTAPAFCPLAP